VFDQEELGRAILLHKTDMASMADRRQGSLIYLTNKYQVIKE
jgi:hypothetical protein